MNASLPITCLLLAATGLLAADVPRKPLPSKYRSLWTESPFTTKPVIGPADTYNPLQDFVLLGVAPINEGYRVTVLNRKRPNDGRTVIETNRPSDGFQIVDVMHSPGSPMKTKVKLAKSGKSGIVGFEDKFLTLKAPPAAAVQQQANNRVQPTAKDPKRPEPRVPRRRIIPPTSGGGQQGQKTNSSNQQRGSTAPTRTPRTR